MVASIPLAPVEEAYSSHRYYETPLTAKAAGAYSAERVINAQARLFEAEDSTHLLASEFVNILHDEFGVSPIIILQNCGGLESRLLASQGCSLDFASSLTTAEINSIRQNYNGQLYEIGSETLGRYSIYVGENNELPRALFELLIKQLESGLEKCYWRTIHNRDDSYHHTTTQANLQALPGMVCRSKAMLSLVEQVHSLSRSNITVLITGESGTGKELVARAIHALSSRTASPFIPFNCAAMPHEL
ncbi:MAG TPA: sigma 54-interacting transcriptional regulator, partial [Blastocatellia bacterium]|nr:sigma 54-interacting transcriptional regulator [Blastocatellia bacterium]